MGQLGPELGGDLHREELQTPDHPVAHVLLRVGLELGQAFARLGSRVTVVEMLPRVLPREDANTAEVVARSLQADGIELRTALQVVRVERGAGGKRVLCRPAGQPDAPEQAIEVDEILVAVGRRANLEGLGLEAVGVATEVGFGHRQRGAVPAPGRLT